MGRSRLQRAIATAAVLLAAAFIATTQFVHPTFPTAAANPDDPPPGVDLIYLLGAQPHTLVAYDWSGHRRGSITVPSWVMRQTIRMAPDGDAFRMDPGGYGETDAVYLDRLGHVIARANGDSFSPQAWSDDLRHICLNGGTGIVVRRPGEPDRLVTIQAGPDLTGDVALEACGMRAGLAVLTSRTGVFEAGPPTITVAAISLSTGAVLNSRKWATADAISSLDAAYVAVTAQDGVEPTTIYRTADLNHEFGRLDPGLKPLAFSGDDTEMLVTVKSDTGQAIEAFDWRTKRVAWRYDQRGMRFGATIARPNSHEFAVQIVDLNGATQGVVISRTDGSTTRLPYGIPVMVNN
ncbi:MAG TPA: hypothetical protein VJT78_00190 [Candidatus Dormibacteraeota bacterium]|nr:hypothetical protein [Candidatus Dormibacteraeota bacterium]